MEILKKIEGIGQSLWYDNIERSKLLDGSLEKMINAGIIKGITSNPSIFQKAISTSKDYDLSLKPMAWAGMDKEEIFWQLAIQDIRSAADLFLSLYTASDGLDGYVSLEVNPQYAYDSEATFSDASRLWNEVGRRNLMIKIPATKEGIPAIRKAIAAGININATLIFSIERYQEVMEAYLSGLEDRAERGENLHAIASVASFFVSRMDTKIDGYLDVLKQAGNISAELAERLSGKAAIANTRLAYERFESVFHSERFLRLQKSGARMQRPLWASTSTKNPKYRDVVYVEELIAPDSVNTIPPATLEAFLDHGRVEITIHDHLDEAKSVFQELESIGISLNKVTQELEVEGVKAFADAYTSLLEAVDKRRVAALGELGQMEIPVQNGLKKLHLENYPKRFFHKDPSLWTQDEKGQAEIRARMNWIHTPFELPEAIQQLKHLGRDFRNQGFTDAVLLGMGGSSLAPEVIHFLLGRKDLEAQNGLNLTILDSTDPEQVKQIDEKLPLSTTLFIVASKSGTTGEINAFLDYFWDQVSRIKPENPGHQFIAITDPGTKLAVLAAERKFNRLFLADPEVGGRNSALTAFGLVPAALMGLDLDRFVFHALYIASLCSEDIPIQANPGFVLGNILGCAANEGKNKLTLLANERWQPFGDWLEQLVAESSGKEGRGILPVVNEPVLPVEKYGSDRIFVRLEEMEENRELAEQLQKAGHPVISLHLSSPEELAGQFYLWEIAVATACSIIGVNSFDQPDVQDAKLRTLAGLADFKKKGHFDKIQPTAEFPGIKILSELPPTAEKRGSVFRLIGSFIEAYRASTEFVAINAFLPRKENNIQLLQKLRHRIGLKYGLPTTLGFGPRYLHSTGQFHKGGPNTGLFILITAQRDEDIPIPGQGVTFGIFQCAQAIGDKDALLAKGRRVLMIDLESPDVSLLLKD